MIKYKNNQKVELYKSHQKAENENYQKMLDDIDKRLELAETNRKNKMD